MLINTLSAHPDVFNPIMLETFEDIYNPQLVELFTLHKKNILKNAKLVVPMVFLCPTRCECTWNRHWSLKERKVILIFPFKPTHYLYIYLRWRLSIKDLPLLASHKADEADFAPSRIKVSPQISSVIFLFASCCVNFCSYES